MSSILKVNTIQDTDGNNIINENANTITIGKSGDTVQVASGASLVGAGIEWQSTVVTGATHTASANQGLWIDTTSNACTLTLPGSPSVGDQLIFSDFARQWGNNAVTLTLNGSKFQGNTSPAPVYDTEGETVHIVYSGSTQGWIPINDGAVAMETPQFLGTTFYLVVAGGGGGGGERGGGGGAGGYLTNYGGSAITLQKSATYTVTVGTGGAGSASGSGSYVRGTQGNNSVLSGTGITTITATGGGGGGGTSPNSGGDGGSGGGGHASASGGSGNTPNTTPSQGNNGGGSSNSAPYYGSGGGGGANAVGADGTSSAAGNGGAGTSNSITGSAVTYAGGGGGGIYNSIAGIGTGGAGGGGNGGSGGNGSNNQAATDGTDGLGGGGGGAARAGGYSSDVGDGGDGIVILRMATADYIQNTGLTGSPTVTTSGSDTIISWTASGTIAF